MNKLQNSLERMQNQLLLGSRPEKQNGKTTNNLVLMTEQDKKRLQKEITSLTNRINGVKKKTIKKENAVEEKVNPWVIDIFSIKYGYQNKAAKKIAKKSRGSRKKMKRVKTMTLVKTVVLQKGLLQKYKDGLMGISPKNHVFKTRNTELQPTI